MPRCLAASTAASPPSRAGPRRQLRLPRAGVQRALGLLVLASVAAAAGSPLATATVTPIAEATAEVRAETTTEATAEAPAESERIRTVPTVVTPTTNEQAAQALVTQPTSTASDAAATAKAPVYVIPTATVEEHESSAAPALAQSDDIERASAPQERALQSTGGFIAGELPAGTNLSLQLAGGQNLSGTDGGNISILAGEIIIGLEINLPSGKLFNVGGARLRAVVGTLSRSQAQAGECQNGRLGPAGFESVDTPLAGVLGAETLEARGLPSLVAVFPAAVKFRSGGVFRICYTDDGSYSAGHADLLEVVLDVQAYVTDRLPAGTGVRMFLTNGVVLQAADAGEIQVSTGAPVRQFTLDLPSGSVLDTGPARLRVVSASTTRAEAAAGACQTNSPAVAGVEIVDEPLSGPLGAPTLHSRGINVLNTSYPGQISFRLGGDFRVCYSYDGTFAPGHADLAGVLLRVMGVSDSCSTERCLAERTFKCHSLLGYVGEAGTCVLPIGGVLGPLGRASWSARIFATYGGDGMPLPIDYPECGSAQADAEVFCPEGSTAQNCSGLVGCDGATGEFGFSQQVGVVHLFTASAMLPSEMSCTTSSSGVLAAIPFVVCVYCPPGGCPFNTATSRLLLSRQPDPWLDDEVPAWDPLHTCHTSEASPFMLPSPEVAAALDGGPRSDLKRFRPAEGYSMPNWPAFTPTGAWLDICFCLGSCGQGGSWFKVGELAVLDARLAAAATVPGRSVTAPPNQVGQPGQLALERQLLAYNNPVGVVGLYSGSGIRLSAMDVTEDSSTKEACIRNKAVEVDGLNQRNVSSHGGTIRNDRIVFDGGVMGRTITFQSVATVVVCYCPLLGGTDRDGLHACDASPHWIPIGALVIGGPTLNQQWVLPTFKIVRFEYLGVDLLPTDILRLANDTADCRAPIPPVNLCPLAYTMQNGNNPDGHFLCERDDYINRDGTLPTSTMAIDRVRCDEMNENCDSAPLKSMRTTATGLQLTFMDSTTSIGGMGDLGLKDGDVVVLQRGIGCGTNCSPAMLDLAKGRQGFAGLETYLQLDESDGRTVTDSVGERQGFHVGNPSIIFPGKWGDHHLRFHNQSDAFTVGVGEPVEVSLPWSIVLWVRALHTGWHTLCAAGNADGVLEKNEMEIGLAGYPWANGSMFLRQGNESAIEVLQAPGPQVKVLGALSDSAFGDYHYNGTQGWSHVAVVYGGKIGGTLQFFVNGSLALEQRNVWLNATSLPLTCGGNFSSSFPGNGTRAEGWLDIDEVRWYNVPLTVYDITALMSAPDGGVSDKDVSTGAPIGNRIKAAAADEGTEFGKVFEIEHSGFARAPTTPEFTVAADGGEWRRTNRGITRAELFSSSTKRYTVCWERGGSRAEAGKIMFETPAYMTDLGLYNTQSEWDKASPIVVTFTTAGKDTDIGYRYRNAKGYMSLSITFLDMGSLQHLGSSVDGPELSTLNTDSDEWADARQPTCGKLFRELWSSDTERGFPLAKGCFYRRLSRKMREIVMIFDKRNGLAPGAQYQIVMNARASNAFDVKKEAIFISSNDDEYEKRYSSFEVGHVFYKGDNAWGLGFGANDPQFSKTNGISLHGGDVSKNLLTIEDASTRLQVRFKGGEYSTAKIHRGNLLNFWMSPLTAWTLPTTCGDYKDLRVSSGSIRIDCHVIVGEFRKCGTVATCVGRKVVPQAPQVSQISIYMPPDMNDLFGSIVYQMDIFGLLLPDSGVMPYRLMAQIAKQDGSKPNFQVVEGQFFSAPTKEFASLCRVLTSPQDGGEPFQGATSHRIFVKMQLPVLLRGADYSQPFPDGHPPSKIRIIAPQGFSMIGVEATPPNLGMQALSVDGNAASRLNGSMLHTAPTGFGSPNPVYWVMDGRNATYTVEDFTIFPAFTSLVVGFTIDAGNSSLPITDPSNLWNVEVSSPGDHNMTYVKFEASFYRTGIGGVPILARIRDALIQPEDYMLSASADTPVTHWLSIFFKAVQDVTAYGKVDIEAPDAFDFGASCVYMDMDASYYVTGPETVLWPLPVILSCASLRKFGKDSGPFTLARLTVEGKILGARHYGFKLRVTNPTPANLTASLNPGDSFSVMDWNITTRGPEGSPVGATFGGAAGAPDGTGSWRLVGQTLPPMPSIGDALATNSPGVGVYLTSWKPFTIRRVAAICTVVMMVGNDFEGYLQVSAPSGFDWLATLVYLRPGAPWNATTNFTEFPANVSSDTQGSMLKFQRGNFTGGVRYGFEGPIYVPNFGPVTSNPTFTFTLDKAVKKGPAFPEGMSSVVFAEPVRAIVDGFVMASNRLAGVRTQLLIKVRLATDVAAPHTVRITPPPGYTTSEPNGGCTMRPWPGKLDFSPDEDVLSQATCGWERVDVEKDQYRLILYPNKRTPLTQLLQFRVNAFNPVVNKSAPGPKTVSLGPCGAPQCWSFESKTFFSEEDIDSPQFVDAIPSPEPMEQAALMPFRMPMRNDQPGKASRIVLYFKLGMAGGFKDKEQLPRGIMELNAPPGTKFPQSCAYTIETRRVVIFGSVYNASVLEVDDWEQPAEIISCVGSNERAVIEIDAGLRADKGYAFVIGLTNPLVDAAESNWTIQFQGQFSRPFPTYKLWAFSDLAVEPFVKSSGPSCYQGQCVGAGAGVAVPVVVTVRTQNSIGTAGELHITAPLGFAFDATEGGTKIDGDRPTGCIIREYVGGNLSAAPERWRALERDCLIADRGNPIDGSGTGDMRTVRIIPQYTVNEFDPRPPRALGPSSIFKIALFIHPPSSFREKQDWTMLSFSSGKGPLDVGAMPGWEVIRVMWQMTHSNNGQPNPATDLVVPQVTAGRAFIQDFIIDFILPENAWEIDTLVLSAPMGFTLQNPDYAANSPGSCIQRKMLLPLRALQEEPEATRPAYCMDNVMTIPLLNFGRALQSGELNRLMLWLYNPEAPPTPEQNYWKMEHFAVKPLSGMQLTTCGLIASWDVIPVLSDMSSALTGNLKAAGTVTTIVFRFKTISEASELQVNALEPMGFNFKGAFAFANLTGTRSVPQILVAGWDVIRLVVMMKGHDDITLTIEGVTLPLVPGRTQWQLSTWKLPEENPLGAAYRRDEGFMYGFFVPGQIEVSRATGQTGREAAAILNKRSDLTFDFTSTATLLPGDEMIVRVEGAEFDSGFVLFNSQAAIFVVEPNAAVTERQIGEWSCINGKIASAKWQGVTTPYCETDDYRISEQAKRLALGGVLQSNTTNGPNGTNISFRIATEILLTLSGTAPRLSHIRMKFQVQTPADRTNFLLERWFLEITRIDEPTGKLVIVSTNDGAGVNLAVVTQLPTSPNPVALHNAPLTVIQVKLELDPLDSDAEAIVLSGPPGYRFPANCTVPNQGDRVANAEAMRCIALPYADTLQGMLPRVRLDCMVDRDFFEYVYVPGKGTDCLRKVATTIYVETPALTPSYNDWFVEAVDVTRAPEMPGGRNFTSVGDRLGRGTFQGFDIVDMSAWAVYAALASVSLDIGISFESRVDMPPLGEVFITAPETLTNFGCSNRRGEILPLSLGPVLSCTTGLEPKSVRLKLNSTLKAGLQLILIPGETSSEPSSIGEKVFQIFLVGPDGKNLDVALSVPAEKVQQGLRVSVWPLWWTKLIWGKPFFYVTIPLEVISEAGMSLRALLIDLPMSPESGGLQFYGTDFEVTTAFGEGLVTRRSGPAAVVSQGGGSALIRLDSSVRLSTGLTLIRFKVRAALDTPKFNFWRVALCGGDAGAAVDMDSDDAGCSLGEKLREERGPAITAVFALAGFNPYDDGPQNKLNLVGLAKRKSVPVLGLLLAALATSILTSTAS